MKNQHSPIVITANNVSIKFKKNYLLHSINLEINQGDKWSIIGPNGAGKTTLLNLLSGQIHPSEGEIILTGQPIKKLTLQQKAQQLSFVHQQDHIQGLLTVKEYVELGGLSHHSATKIMFEIDTLFKVLKLDTLKNKFVSQLSGGEQQRIKIARALWQQPTILFLDEPTNHLDPYMSHFLLSWLSTLNITIVMVLHDISLAKQFTTHTLILKTGQIIGLGHSAEMLRPQLLFSAFDMPVLELNHPLVDGKSFVVYDFNTDVNATESSYLC